MTETQKTSVEQNTPEEKKARVEFKKDQPHPKLTQSHVREYQPEDDEKATPLGQLKSHFHPTGTAIYVSEDGTESYFPYKAVSPGDSVLLNHTALIASARAMTKKRVSKKDGRYTVDDAIAEGCLEEYLKDVQNEKEYVCRVVSMGLVSPEQQMTWEEVPENIDERCMMFLFDRFLGGAVPSADSERTERFSSKDAPSENGSEPEASTD